MKHTILLLTGILFNLTTLLKAQSIDTFPKTDTLNPYIEYMKNYINLKLSHTSDVDELSVITAENDIYLKPNTRTISRFYFNYRFISFSFKYVPKWLPGNDDDDIRGKSKTSGLGINLNMKRWLQEISYSKTKGYYLDNTSDYDPDWKEGDPYIQFPQLEFKSFQGSTGYKFNPNFSINAVATQTERQLKSAGSFIPRLYYRYYIIDNKEDLEPGETSQKSNNFEIVLGAGYYHTFVVKNDFYISLGATPGLGKVYTKLTTRLPDGEDVVNQNNTIFRFEANAGAGYNGERFFAGLYSRLSASAVDQQNTSVINTDARFILQGFVGYRLNAPKWMREKVDAASKLIPL